MWFLFILCYLCARKTTCLIQVHSGQEYEEQNADNGEIQDPLDQEEICYEDEAEVMELLEVPHDEQGVQQEEGKKDEEMGPEPPSHDPAPGEPSESKERKARVWWIYKVPQPRSLIINTSRAFLWLSLGVSPVLVDFFKLESETQKTFYVDCFWFWRQERMVLMSRLPPEELPGKGHNGHQEWWPILVLLKKPAHLSRQNSLRPFPLKARKAAVFRLSLRMAGFWGPKERQKPKIKPSKQLLLGAGLGGGHLMTQQSQGSKRQQKRNEQGRIQERQPTRRVRAQKRPKQSENFFDVMWDMNLSHKDFRRSNS